MGTYISTGIESAINYIVGAPPADAREPILVTAETRQDN